LGVGLGLRSRGTQFLLDLGGLSWLDCICLSLFANFSHEPPLLFLFSVLLHIFLRCVIIYFWERGAPMEFTYQVLLWWWNGVGSIGYSIRSVGILASIQHEREQTETFDCFHVLGRCFKLPHLKPRRNRFHRVECGA
jgi:hypothetical protein